MKKTAAQLLLVLNLAIYWGYGVAFLAAPKAIAGLLGIELTTVTAVGDFRAMYSGLCLAAGFVFLKGLRDPAWHVQALWLATLGAAGLGLGRVVTFVTEGATSPILLALLASEVGAIAIGAYVLMPTASTASPTAAALPR